MSTYQTMKANQQKEIDEFPMFFAFSQKQFAEGMQKFGLNPNDTGAVYKLGKTGGFCRCDDCPKLFDLFEKHIKETQDAIDSAPTGDGFVFDMFRYELDNHEYIVTYDVSDTLDALDLTFEEVKNSKKLSHGLNKAVKHIEARRNS